MVPQDGKVYFFVSLCLFFQIVYLILCFMIGLRHVGQ